MGTWPHFLLLLSQTGVSMKFILKIPVGLVLWKQWMYFRHLYILFSLVAFSHSTLFSLPLSFHIALNIIKQKTKQQHEQNPNRTKKEKRKKKSCLMQFEARQAHFIKDCKTLSGTRVFMCNQMQQLA